MYMSCARASPLSLSSLECPDKAIPDRHDEGEERGHDEDERRVDEGRKEALERVERHRRRPARAPVAAGRLVSSIV